MKDFDVIKEVIEDYADDCNEIGFVPEERVARVFLRLLNTDQSIASRFEQMLLD